MRRIVERDRLERRERNSSEARVRERKQTSSLTSLLDEDGTKKPRAREWETETYKRQGEIEKEIEGKTDKERILELW